MPPRPVLALQAAFLAAASCAFAASPQEVCPRLRFVGEAVSLSDVEERLVCGDPESEAWRGVPASQAEGFLRAFLQTRGYQRPSFRFVGEALEVETGSRTVITSLTASGLPDTIDISKRRKVVGQVLTPKMLDLVKAALTNSLQNVGYACPQVDVTAQAETGRVMVEVEPGPLGVVGAIEEPELEGIDPGVFRRFEAFRRGKPLELRLLNLTADRIVSEALFLSAYYDIRCSSEGSVIALRAVPAPPRLATVGVGVDTEGIFRLRARWKHALIGKRASSMESAALASFREQSLESLVRYYLRPSSRLYLMPRVFAERRDEERFEAVTAEFSLAPASTWDSQDLRLELRAGPAVQYVDTRRGLGPEDATFLNWDGRAALSSHDFEYFARDPRSGWQASLDTTSRLAGLYSEFTTHRVRLGQERLWNLGAYDPPLLIAGERGWVGTTWVSDPRAKTQELPPAMRFFLGGDSDFRGVRRRALPGDEVGFFTAVYQGLELRLGDVLPYRLQPYVFVDGAMGGRSDVRLERDVYYAPGFGLRWASPVGGMRATLARGAVWKRDPATPPQPKDWQFFFSFGREF